MRGFLVVSALMLTGCDRADPTPVPARPALALHDISEETWRDVEALECKPDRVDYCGAEGCKQSKPVVTVRWEPKGSYQRCDAKGCDSYEPVVSTSGVWANISNPKNGMFMRVTADGQYVEVATINEVVLVYHGRCVQVKAR
jgi:hypothetical protein